MLMGQHREGVLTPDPYNRIMGIGFGPLHAFARKGLKVDVQTATEILSGISYKPGWKLSVHSSYTELYTKAQVLVVQADYHVNNSDRFFAPEYDQEIDVTTYWPINLSAIDNGNAEYDKAHFVTQVFSAIVSVETHEAREFFAYDTPLGKSDMVKPFHPHTREGQHNFAAIVGDPRSIELDLVFGQVNQSEERILSELLNSGWL